MKKLLAMFGALAIAAVAMTACVDITNPVEDFGELTGPYVRWSAVTIPPNGTTPVRAPGGAVLNAIVQLPTRLEENVTVQINFGGTAVFGTDYRILDNQGNPRAGITQQGGSVVITYRPAITDYLADTLRISVPATANRGRTGELTLHRLVNTGPQ
jgi:hypothetical protein